MMQLELPHVNVLTKMDLLKRSSAEVEQCVVHEWCSLVCLGSRAPSRRYLQPDAQYFLHELQHSMGGKYARLNEAVAALVRCAWLGGAEQALMRAVCRLTTTASSASCRSI